MLIDSTIPYHQTFAKIYDNKTTAKISTLRSDLGFKGQEFLSTDFPIEAFCDDDAKRMKMIKNEARKQMTIGPRAKSNFGFHCPLFLARHFTISSIGLLLIKNLFSNGWQITRLSSNSSLP